MEQCANCGRTIGNLETPHVFQSHVVCAECVDRLQRSVASAPSAAATVQALFDRERAVVTTERVSAAGRELPVDQILAVKTERQSFSRTRFNVFVVGLLDKSFPVPFNSAGAAKDFITAIRRANPSVRIDRDQWMLLLGF